MPPPPTSKVVLRSLYRSLLRAAAPFSPPSPSAAAYASLLHRSGVSYDWEECIHKLDSKRRAASSNSKGAPGKKNEKEYNLPKSWAQNLSRSYTDLQDEYALRKEYFEERYGAGYDQDDRWDDEDIALEMAVGSSSYYRQEEDYIIEEDPKFILFRHLLREWFAGGGGVADDGGRKRKKMLPRQWSPNEGGYYENRRNKRVPVMRFPSQIVSDGGLSLRELIQREFRAPSAEERQSMESKSKEENTPESSTSEGPPSKEIYSPSSFIDNEIRIQTAFYTLMELNRKLAWAKNIGFPPSSQKSTKAVQRRMKLVQAAKGVSLLSTIQPNELADVEPNGDIKESDNDGSKAAKSSSPLQAGTYLVAHPLMTGYFARTVIVLLDHEEGGTGGTYGVIVNRLALQSDAVESSRRQIELLRQNWEQKKSQLEKEPKVFESSSSCTDSSSLEEAKVEPSLSSETATSSSIKSSSPILRPISLLQAIDPDDLPDTVQMAFGDAPVREGGPVNLSLQMIYRKAQDSPSNVTEEDEYGKNEGPSSKIGGIMLGSGHDKLKDSDDAIYFNGDIIKASYAVLEGDCDREDFSFIIGASCWSPGQLEHEIESGSWLPFRGPPHMAMTGMCEHDETTSEDIGDDTPTGTKLSLFPPRPSNAAAPVAGSTAKAASQQSGQSTTRPVGDLWLSVMCALGEGEADLAYMMLDSKSVKDPFGDACDNFDR